MKEEVRVKCCYTLWMCWSERNRIREGESRRSACWLAHSILVQIEEWKKTIVQKISSSNDRISKWEKPEAGFVKVNCDAAFDGTSGNVGQGCILRDDKGDTISARRVRVESLMSAFHGELIAAIQGSQAAAEMSVGHVIIETDAIEVVQAVYSDAFDLSPMTFLVTVL